jgi:hypothetical protein
MTAFTVPLVDTVLMMGPRSTDAVRKLTVSSWPSLMKKNQLAAMAITAARKIITRLREPLDSGFFKKVQPCVYNRRIPWLIWVHPAANPLQEIGCLKKVYKNIIGRILTQVNSQKDEILKI